MSDTGRIAPQYDPSSFEGPLYKEWLARGLFRPDPGGGRKPFVMVIPPPNVTAVLHMGHGLNCTVQDVMARFERMRGRDVLWLPGTDHAGIATQNVVEKLLATEGTSRLDLGREAFVRRTEQFVAETGGVILEQLKAIGCSCDWSRTAYTLSPGLSRAVREVFVRLWEEGLIYRGHRVIHWCPRCHTSLSDEEAEHAETDGQLYHIRYPLEGGDGFVTVATTRPETMLGDVAVAVNPDDESRRGYAGRMVRLPIADLPIPVIADEAVQLGFGSGFLKVTPAHDANDFEIGRRHGLPAPVVMTAEARMGDADLAGSPGGRVPGPLFGLDRFEARRKILELLRSRDLLAKTEPHRHAIRRCYRCDTVVEPRLSDQWFVKMQPLAEPALEAYRRGEVRFVPERRGDEYQRWLLNIRDWNISRQLWWGHRIPVWYCDACETMKACREDPAKCDRCGGPLRQDEDVLDTWFSSWLWPFSTLGWPQDTPDLKRYYPTDVLVTAADILFFWVARMIFAGLHFIGRVPFHTVYLHGTVRDTQHRKMSKSLGNGIDPLDVVRLYGADALRFAVTHGLGVGTDIILDPGDLEASFASGRNFANKLWNVGRLVLSAVGGKKVGEKAVGGKTVGGKAVGELEELEGLELRLADRWILSRMDRVVRQTTEHLEKFRLNDAVGAPYHFLWDDLADWYLEEIKPRLRGEEPGGDGEAARAVVVRCFTTVLQLLHPAMPFITEALYRRLPGRENQAIATSAWPSPAGRHDPEAERDYSFFQSLVAAVREIRADFGVTPRQMVRIAMLGLKGRTDRVVGEQAKSIMWLGRVAAITPEPTGAGVTAVLPEGVTLYVELGEATDLDKQCRRLRSERDRLEKQLASLSAKLANPHFVSRAPAMVVEGERVKQREWGEKLERLARHLADLRCA